MVGRCSHHAPSGGIRHGHDKTKQAEQRPRRLTSLEEFCSSLARFFLQPQSVVFAPSLVARCRSAAKQVAPTPRHTRTGLESMTRWEECRPGGTQHFPKRPVKPLCACASGYRTRLPIPSAFGATPIERRTDRPFAGQGIGRFVSGPDLWACRGSGCAALAMKCN